MIGRLATLPRLIAPARQRLIVADGVSIALGGRVVVRNVSLEVSRGETLSLIGPNGSGKTTLVRAMLGLVPVMRGHITLEPGMRTGYVPQRFEPDPVLPLSVARFLRLGTKAASGRYDAVLDEVGCSHLARQQLVELSGGELRRVLIARALLRDPDLLVLDEPVQQVDVTGQLDLYRLIGRIRDEHHCGIVVVSHDLHIVMASTDRVVCLNGHVCCSGAPEAVSRHPEYLALFGSRAAQGIAVYAHAHDHVHEPSGEVVPLGQGGAAQTEPEPDHRHGAEQR
jgi:zinc transport system ATP-binding protein